MIGGWLAGAVFEETEGVLFPADLFIQPGDQPPTEMGASTTMRSGVYPARRAAR